MTVRPSPDPALDDLTGHEHGGDCLVSPGQAAHLLGVRTPVVSRYARDGYLWSLLLPGGQRRYCRRDIDAMLGRS